MESRISPSRERRPLCHVHPYGWTHHLENGGWKWVSEAIQKNFHDRDAKVDLYTAYESQVKTVLRRPFIAFFHEPVRGCRFSLSDLARTSLWKQNARKLLGAFTVSNTQKEFLSSIGITNVRTVHHPTPLNVRPWRKDKLAYIPVVYHFGLKCRDVGLFMHMAKSGIGGLRYVYVSPRKKLPYSIIESGSRITLRLSAPQYNHALTSGIVFQHLTAATANNVVLECIARQTPVIINPVGGIPEYLGEDYPLYYRTASGARLLLEEIGRGEFDRLCAAHEYLGKRRNLFSLEYFIESIRRSLAEWLPDAQS